MDESLEQLLHGCRPSHLTLRREQERQALLDRTRPESAALAFESNDDMLIDDDVCLAGDGWRLAEPHNHKL